MKILTFSPMVDSECTRLVLTHYGIPFDERDHIFGLASLLTFLHGGYGRIPLVYGDGLRSSGPRRTVDKLDAKMGDRRLIPLDPAIRSEVEQSWALYNGQLAADVAVFAYYHLLPDREIMVDALRRPIVGIEQKWVGATYTPVRLMLRALLRLTSDRAADALSRIRKTLDFADKVVGDGRSYLHGQSVTLADLGLASALAPLAVPRRYEQRVPPVEQMPEELRNVVLETRLRPVSKFADGIIRMVEGQIG